MTEGKGIAGTISCWGYGYGVKMLVNGKDIGIAGGKSENKRLFSPDHEMYNDAPPEIRDRLFVLKEGANEISVEFSKSSGKDEDYLQIALELVGYHAPIFMLHSRSKASAKIKKAVAMHTTAPEGFRPIFISDKGENRSVAVHVETMNCTVTPMLNGKEGMTLAGMAGQSVLENVNEGRNELVVRYKGEPGEELRFAVISPEWAKFLVKKISDDSEKTETFVFGGAGAQATPPRPGGIGQASEMLKSNDSMTRLRAAGALREAAERGEDIGAAEGALIEALSDKDKDFRETAARLLAYFYGRLKRWADINRLLEHKQGDVRSSVLYKTGEFAGQFGIQSGIPNITKALDDSEFDVRKEAALFFEKASAKGVGISFALPGLKKAAIYGDERMKEAATNAIHTAEMRKEGGGRCRKCLDCETGFGPGDAAKCFTESAVIIKSISCCGGDVTHKVQRCSACGKHYLSTYFDHSDTGHGQFSITLVGKEDAERIAAEFKKCPNPEWRSCKCDVHMAYLKEENVPIKGELKYNFEDKD